MNRQLRRIYFLSLLWVSCLVGVAADPPCETRYVYGELSHWTSPAGREVIKVLTNCGYLVGYSETRKDPLWAAYHLRKVGAVGAQADNPDRKTHFSTDQRTTSRINHDDYTTTDFDRGHMAPSYGIGSRFGQDAQNETFTMSNVCPQKETLNQRTWKWLEAKEADDFANAFGEVWVITGPIFNRASTTLSDSGVQVPYAFYKIVMDEEHGKPRMLGFKMEQGTMPTHNFDSCLIKGGAIERETGLTFLGGVPGITKLKAKSPAFIWKVR